MSIAIPLIGKPGRPSEDLTRSEHNNLKAMFHESGSFTKLASELRMNRMTITRILKNGAGSPVNVQKLRTKLSKQKSSPKKKAA